MTDRSLKVKKNSDGTLTVSGVAYVADAPNANDVVYPRKVLEKALKQYLEEPEDERLLMQGCAAKPTLRNAIGVVTDGSIDEEGIVRLEAKTLPLSSATLDLLTKHPEQLAFAGAGYSEDREEENGILTISKFKITSMGVVPVREVEPCKHERQTKKRYPNPAKCKECGATICPDCDGTKFAAWGKCGTCKGRGILFEENPDD